MVVVGAARDVEPLVAEAGLDGARVRVLGRRAIAALAADRDWDLVVAAHDAAEEVELGAALAARDAGAGRAPLVLLADRLTVEVACFAHRHGARVCRYEHGPEPLRLAILAAADEAAAYRERAEAEVAAEQVRALVHYSVSDVVFHLRVEGDGFRFIEVNPAFLRATGLSEEQVVGKRVDEIIPEPSLATVLSKYRRAIAERRTVRWEEVTPYPAGTKYGEVSITPVIDAHGRCTRMVGTVHDVTEARRHAESSLEQLRELSARIDGAREEERIGIARELHDQLGQSLTVLKMDLASVARGLRGDGPREPLLERLTGMMKTADDLIDEVRRISAELRPAILEQIGLGAALSWQAQEFAERTHVEAVVDNRLPEEHAIDRGVALTVFRVFQEALTNVARHAGAHHVRVSLAERDGAILLEVRDDGRGIAQAQIDDPHALGLVGMRERARRLGGTVALAAVEPHGTLVTLTVPAR
jgi:PAS domain S-box-containing protein